MQYLQFLTRPSVYILLGTSEYETRVLEARMVVQEQQRSVAVLKKQVADTTAGRSNSDEPKKRVISCDARP